MAKYNSIIDISEILNDYSEEVQEGISKTAQEEANKGKAELKIASPKRTGEYSRGWRVNTKKGRGFISCIIHNATNYQLTHLLEKPHAKRNGGITTPKVHIKPVEERIVREYENQVEKIIKNGG